MDVDWFVKQILDEKARDVQRAREKKQELLTNLHKEMDILKQLLCDVPETRELVKNMILTLTRDLHHPG